ncbi:MAG: lipopolysaccharide heptosyltransferase II [Proteobacteria bacterium]|nr:MAG: lipopolysaccharide heptosyltransferase II [Pseudomonadota bacterium]
MVMAQSLFMSIKARHPDAFVGVLAPAWTEPLLERMPEVDLAIAADFRHGRLGLGERLAKARALRALRFDQAIILPRSIKSALAPFLARIPRRTSYLGEMRYGLVNDVRPMDQSALPLTVQRFVFLSAPRGATLDGAYPLPRFEIDARRVDASLDALGLSRPARPVLALGPGAEYGPAKRWPARHFAALARRAAGDGYAVWLFGSEKDRDITAAIAGESDADCLDLAGRTRLGQAVDLMSLAAVVVSNDSGLMHVAAALERPLVALFGSSSASFTPPLSPRARVLSLELECSPCFARKCPLGHLRCLVDLEPSRVYDAVREGGSGTGSGPAASSGLGPNEGLK